MNYTLNASWAEALPTDTENILQIWIKKFEKLIGPENNNWRKNILDSNKMKPKEKVKSLLKHVRVTNIQSFIYFVRNVVPESVSEKLRIMNHVHELLGQVPEIHLSNADKLCYVRLALAKLLGHLFRKKQDKISEQEFLELEDKTIEYSYDLCEVDYDNPEPYLFYLMLTWPFADQLEEGVKVIKVKLNN
jgi:hypothetical protein